MIGISIKNKIPKAAIKVKEFVKRLPSRFIKILALRNSPNIKATIPKGIIRISANVGKIKDEMQIVIAGFKIAMHKIKERNRKRH